MRRPRWQRIVAVVAAVLLVTWSTLRAVAGIVLDRWWFDTVTDTDVWSTIVGAQVQLAFAAAVITAVVLGTSVLLPLREYRDPSELSSMVIRYRARMGPAHRWVMLGLAAFLVVRIGHAAMDQWQSWLLFRHGGSLGRPVPALGGDLGSYLFQLPFLTVVSGWVRQLVIAGAALAIFGYAVSGAVHLPVSGRTSSGRAITHLGILGAVFSVLQALDYLLVRRPGFAFDRQGAFDGPGFTDLIVGIPLMWVLAVAALATAAAFVFTARTGRWRPTLILVGGWVVLHVLATTVIPGLVDRFVVHPAEAARELPHIAHNLEATRSAYGLEAVAIITAPIADGLTEPLDPVIAGDLTRVPLFRTDQLVSALQVLQGTRATRITDVDLDRYDIDGVVRPVMLAARNSSRGDLPEQGWVQTHLVYTHGDGVVAVPADVPDEDGRPDVDALATVLVPARPELYFGENLAGWYAIVGTRRTEQGGAVFAGDTGIPIGSWWRKAVLSAAVGEIEPLLSAELTEDSQLLYRRDVRERLAALAPFLTFDGDPYPVVTGDGVVWVVDAYTTASTYPYSQFSSAGSVGATGLHGSFNYLHASVKATVDAYDGSVHLYRTDVGGADDPVLDVWERIFPGLIEPISELPEELRSHLHYPPDLLAVQTELLGRYHVTDAEALFSGTDRWSVSTAASVAVGEEPTGPAPAVSLFMPPVGPQAEGHWVAIRPYSPGASGNPAAGRDELVALAIADHDDPEHLTIVVIEDRPGRQVATPQIAQSAIDADPAMARLFTLLNANGSKVQFGPMTPIPIGDALVWTRPIVVSGTATTTVPRLYGVVSVSNGLVGLGDDVPQSVNAAVNAVSAR